MSLRASLFVVIALMLAGCGFSPVYGSKAAAPAVEATLDQVHIDNIPDRAGQVLRNALIDRFYRNGRPGDAARYTLRVAAIQETRTNLDITKGASATRAQLRLDTQVTLIDNRGMNTVMERRLLAITSYNILQSQFTTRVAEEAARQAALDDLAGQIERHIALHFNRQTR